MRTFVLAAVVQPDLQQKAHEELDRICGSERLPAVEDIDKLLYVQAIIKEAMRWRPITAGGIPHAVERDDEYMGYRIPKDAVVIGNNWGIHHDEELYPEPEKIRPERWIENPQLPFTMWGGSCKALFS